MVDTNVYDATQIGNCVESRICYCLYNRVKCLLCLISINCHVLCRTRIGTQGLI